jgi:hypothetical protein
MAMASTGKKWFIGCGIGCGLMLLILGGAGTCAYFGVKQIKEKADGLDVSFEEVKARFGEPADFTPSPDGVISPDRMEVFLAIRDDMTPVRQETSGMLSILDGGGNFIAKAKAGLQLVPALVGFVGERNKILVDRGMGVGEYQHIYALSYFVLLAKDPADGPSFALSGDDREHDGNVRIDWGSHSGDKGRVGEARAKRVRLFVNDLQRKVLDNQVAAFVATLPAGSDPAADPWGARLVAEQQAMQRETLRFPWEEGLPAQLAASLEPYRDRLDATYDAMTSVIEMGLTDED